MDKTELNLDGNSVKLSQVVTNFDSSKLTKIGNGKISIKATATLQTGLTKSQNMIFQISYDALAHDWFVEHFTAKRW